MTTTENTSPAPRQMRCAVCEKRVRTNALQATMEDQYDRILAWYQLDKVEPGPIESDEFGIFVVCQFCIAHALAMTSNESTAPQAAMDYAACIAQAAGIATDDDANVTRTVVKVEDFQQAGHLSADAGFIVTTADGSQFEVTVVKIA